MNPYTSTRRWLARTTAPWMVALSAGVSPPAVSIPIRFIDASERQRQLALPPATTL
jgi:hypothetical protein